MKAARNKAQNVHGCYAQPRHLCRTLKAIRKSIQIDIINNVKHYNYL